MMWTEEGDPIGRVFDEAERAARAWRVELTHRHQPCILHTEPGPEMWEDEDGNEYPVTDEMREQWDREGVDMVIQRTYVGTCHTNGCDPSLPGADRWLYPTAPAPEPMRTDSHTEEPPATKPAEGPAPAVFWIL